MNKVDINYVVMEFIVENGKILKNIVTDVIKELLWKLIKRLISFNLELV